MNKKLMSLVISGLLVGSLMVGCSSSNTNNKNENSIKEEKHMTEEERIATLKGLEGDALTEAYRKLLTEEEIKYLEQNGCKLEEEAKYYQDGLSLRQRFCDMVNAIWGLGIYVEPSETVLNTDYDGDGDIDDDFDQSGITGDQKESDVNEEL